MDLPLEAFLSSTTCVAVALSDSAPRLNPFATVGDSSADSHVRLHRRFLSAFPPRVVVLSLQHYANAVSKIPAHVPLSSTTQ
jgi:hypothetical protein